MTCTSWDVFDTLIGRKCGTPAHLWAQVGQVANLADFPRLRYEAERAVQQAGQPYTIDTIYHRLARDAGRPELRELRDAELQAERDNVFPIARYAAQVRPGDVAVSDMYLTPAQVRVLLDAAGIEPSMFLYVSCYGKSKRTIWPQLISRHGLKEHVGDSQTNDVDSPQAFGLHGTRVDTALSAAEAFYAGHGESLAWWCRYHRLRAVRGGTDHALAELQIEYNVPFLLAVAYDIRRVLEQKRLGRVVFLARDGYLLQRLWQRLCDIPAEYVLASRECLRNGTPGYVAYLDSRLDANTLLVDLAASFRSFAAIAPKLRTIPAVYTACWVPYDGRLSASLDMTRLLDQRSCMVNNTYIEMLNYAPHWHVADVAADGTPSYSDQGEYDMPTVQRYHAVVDAMLADVPPAPIAAASIASVAEHAARRINDAGKQLEAIFPGHMRLERKRKLPPLPPTIRSIPVPLSNQTNRPPVAAGTVIVGAIDQLRYDRCEIWARSIEQAGFRGQVHMLCYRTHPQCIKMLERLHKIVCHRLNRERHVVVCRFRDLAELARTLPPQTWMIQLDVSDLVMQRDPDQWLAKLPPSTEIVVGSETIKIGDQWWVAQNFRDCFPEHFDEMKGRLLYNAGSFAARAGTMAELAADVWAVCTSKPWTKPNDQDALNWLLWQPKYRGRVCFAKQRAGWCANIAAPVIEPKERGADLCDEPLARLRNGVCVVEGDVVPCFLHHYTRDKRWNRDVVDRIKLRPRSIEKALARKAVMA